MIVEVSGIRVSLEGGEGMLLAKLAELFSLPRDTFASMKVLSRSLDARRTRPPFFVYRVEVALPDTTQLPDAGGEVAIRVTPEIETRTVPVPLTNLHRAGKTGKTQKVVVIGCGPAGLFAALRLSEKGIPVLLLERGKPVPERFRDVQAFWAQGSLQRESNVHFGEGGAGTFSDGKLTSRVKDPRTRLVKETLVELGAPAEILIDAKAHIGTDRLRKVVVNFRQRLTARGCEIRFGSRVSDLQLQRGRVAGVMVNDREEIPAEHLLLAIGQNADDTYRMLQGRAVLLAPKPFALGLRVEHPQLLINQIQYGKWFRHPGLPPAEYFLTARVTQPERSVYTFCMCPGGQVIGCSSEAGGLITNGMSRSARDGLFANSAVVVNVTPADFDGDARDSLQGLRFRRRWEEKAFLLGGKDYFAPAQRLTDFLQGRESDQLAPTSFRPGVKAAPLAQVLPIFAREALIKGLRQFEGKMPGFISPEAMLIGVETRTSAPVRILRDAGGQSVNTAGLYPCGEGAGYAGGIISSALDGVKAAENIIRSLA